MILDEIIASAHHRASMLPGSFERSSHTPISLKQAIRAKQRAHTRPVIAELKFASPSHGTIRKCTNQNEIAQELVHAGCCALSVLTEPDYFSGCCDTIPLIREHVPVPILRKDFIVDKRQLDESRALGADAVLLIAHVLGEETDSFVDAAKKCGLEPLVEVHTRQEAKMAVDTGADLIGINNRDLRTFKTDLSTTKLIAPILHQAGKTVISLSGMIWPCDIRFMSRYADGFLIGSSIMASHDPKKRVEGFVYA